MITSVVNLFFVQTGGIALAMGPLRIHWGGVEAAVLYTVRFFLLLVAGSLLTLTTTPVALADAAERLLSPLERLGVPVGQGALVLSIALRFVPTLLSIALRFVPTLSQEAEHIVAAQTARGADLENKGALAYARACVPLIVPLFASALRHADTPSRTRAPASRSSSRCSPAPFATPTTWVVPWTRAATPAGSAPTTTS